jgi:hypothetical protein
MANTNTLTNMIPTILAMGQRALRENAITSQLVNRAYDSATGNVGSTVDVPIPSAITASSVTPDVTAPDPTGVTPTVVPIALTNWYEAPFFLSDTDMKNVNRDIIPMQVSEAIRALANKVDTSILALGNQLYGAVGTAGTTPFAGSTGARITSATDSRKLLNQQLAPMEPRYMVIDPAAEANALALDEMRGFDFIGSAEAVRDGNLDRKLGFAFHMNQNVQSHTAGAAANYVIDDAGGALSIGDTSIPLKTGTGDVHAGDIVTFAGHDQTYRVTETVAAPASSGITITPGLVAVPADGEAMTLVDDHVMNLAFHRDCFALATRPLDDGFGGNQLGGITQSTVDPISGLTLRLEVRREHKRTRWSFDVLWGVACIRPELGVRLLG